MTVRPNSPVLRSEIETALNEIISNEEGMSFQGLAVGLARQRWPELIASERKNDLGLDAYASASLSPDKVGKGLASSITGELSKITDDAKKVKQHFTDVSVLLFYTPEKVSNPKKKEWAERIRKDFGYDLHVMSREEIITALMEPRNVSLCGSILAIDVETDAATSEIIERIVEAAAAEAATWTARTPGPLISLQAARIDDVGNDSSDLYRIGSIIDALDEGRKLVLEGPAGRGKTTTLSQIAKMQTGCGDVAFLIDLPGWISSGRPILEFVAQSPAFQARGLDAPTLARIKDAVQFSFLLNGWNEIEVSDSVRAGEALRTLDRSFTSAGIIVATRTHHIRPPLPGAQRLRLLQLTRRQRNDYLRQRLADRARDLARQLDTDATLDALTRTPLVLSGVTSIFSSGNPIPKTKMGVLDAVARLMEDAPEHSVHLASPPLSGFHHRYLCALATQMTARGAVSVPDADARAIAHTVAQGLLEAHQIGTLPAPVDVLAALCAHDVLERLEYPAIAFRFTHQQFQELYAAVDIKQRLLQVAARNQEDERRDFTATYVNAPAWAEPLRMIAETIGLQRDAAPADRNEVKAGRAVVDMALDVDPVFAAELARLCGTVVWLEVGPTVSARLRSWYGVADEHHRNCALAAMIASGADEFQDTLVPFLAGGDQQLSLRTYRLQPDLHLTSLGPRWRETVSPWNEGARATFVSELLRDRFVPEIVDYALADNSEAVQKAALDGLIWNGLDDEAAQFLEATKPQTFDAIVRVTPPDLVPAPVRARALAAFQKLPDDADAASHLTTLLKRAELGEVNSNQVKETLERLPDQIAEHWMQYAIKKALDLLRPAEPEWVSHWVAGRIASGSLWARHWKPFVTSVPPALTEASLRKLESEDLKNAHFGGLIAIIVAGADAKLAARVFSNLRRLRETIAAAPDQRHDFEWQLEHQLDTLFRDLPLDLAAEGLLSVATLDPVDIQVVSRLFTRVARHDAESITNLDAGLKGSLHTYIKKGLERVLQQEDYNGELKANYASVIAQLGEPDDMNDLLTLVRADVDRVARGQAARAAGDRGPAAMNSNMCQSPWLIRAIAELNSPRTDDVLIELLREPEYERWVAEEFPKLTLPPKTDPFAKIDYNQIWTAREGREAPDPYRERRQRFAAALRERTAQRLEEYRRDPKASSAYLLKELAKALAALDPRGSAEIVLNVMCLPANSDGWHQAAALERMLFGGAALPIDPILAMVDAAIAHAQQYGPQDNERWLVNRFLCILPFVDAPARGIQKIRDVIALPWVHAYELRGVATALGHSRCIEALDLLRELVSDAARARQLEDDWINAVAALNTPAARDLLVSFVDPEIAGLPDAVRFDRQDVLAARIADCARQDAAIDARLRQLCERELPTPKRLLLTKVMNFLGTPEALLAALNLIDDSARPPYDYDTWQQLENAFVEKKPYGHSQGTYTLTARAANDVRLRLFEMLNDPRRKRSAFSLLGQIEEWRLEHGRPLGEPRHPAFGAAGPWPPAEPRD